MPKAIDSEDLYSQNEEIVSSLYAISGPVRDFSAAPTFEHECDDADLVEVEALPAGDVGLLEAGFNPAERAGRRLESLACMTRRPELESASDARRQGTGISKYPRTGRGGSYP